MSIGTHLFGLGNYRLELVDCSDKFVGIDNIVKQLSRRIKLITKRKETLNRIDDTWIVNYIVANKLWISKSVDLKL